MNKKIIFFDIDGTIWDYKNDIPASTVKAFELLKNNGHYTLLCTGRTKSTIRARQIKNLGYDGLVAGLGTYIEWQGQILVNDLLDYETIKTFVPAMKQKGIGAFLEGVDKLYIDWDYYAGAPYAEGFRKELGADCLDICEADENSRINKFSIEYIDIPHDEIIDFFGNAFDVTIHDFKNPDGSPLNVAEIVTKGYSKATGMDYICEFLGMDIEDTYAFGDSANDIDMLRHAGCGIAMGNASTRTKTIADYVTTPLGDDGIWNALKHYGLI